MQATRKAAPLMGLATLAALGLAAAHPAQAQTVITSGPTVAREVDGVVVGGVDYDVTFTAYHGDLTFNNQSALAQTAASEIDAALNAAGIAYLYYPGVGSVDQFLVADRASLSGVLSGSGFTPGGFTIDGDGQYLPGYATFTPAPAPEPSTVAAFAFTGLFAAGLILRASRRPSAGAKRRAVA